MGINSKIRMVLKVCKVGCLSKSSFYYLYAMEKAYPDFSYVPGRTKEALENERLQSRLQSSHEERFRKLVALINISQKLKSARKKS
jgi:hypothetical protein